MPASNAAPGQPAATRVAEVFSAPWAAIREALAKSDKADVKAFGETLGLKKVDLPAGPAVIYVLQLYEDDVAKNGGESRIKNPGGYFRALTRMVKTGKIDLAVELLAMRRRRMS